MSEMDVQRIEQKLDTLISDVRTLKRHVVGESDPELSLMYRVAQHERELDDMRANKKQVTSLGWTALGTGVTALVMWGWSKMTGKTP